MVVGFILIIFVFIFEKDFLRIVLFDFFFLFLNFFVTWWEINEVKSRYIYNKWQQTNLYIIIIVKFKIYIVFLLCMRLFLYYFISYYALSPSYPLNVSSIIKVILEFFFSIVLLYMTMPCVGDAICIYVNPAFDIVYVLLYMSYIYYMQLCLF
jgi:hypothetical protein